MWEIAATRRNIHNVPLRHAGCSISGAKFLLPLLDSERRVCNKVFDR